MDITKYKRKLFFLNTTNDCPLDFKERLIYSELAYRAKYGRGATKTQLRRNLRLDPKTINRGIEGLKSRSLATIRGNEYYAVEPDALQKHWFRQRRTENKSWHSRYSYIVILKPSENCSLTARQNVLYWLVVSLRKKKRRVTAAYLSKIMGIAPQTARKALERLVELSFLDDKHHPIELTELDWTSWQDARRKRSQGQNPEREVQYRRADTQVIYDHLREHGVPVSMCKELVRLAVHSTLDTKDVLLLSEKKADFSRQQQAEGKQTVDHHGYLLRTALKSMQARVG